jgi:formate-dependent nitrite reductase membrane component NrfD
MGTYLVGLIAQSWWATVVGWLLIVLFKLPLHLIYLGRPLRFWRAIPPFTKAWKTSWLARGMFFSTVFVACGFGQIVAWYLLFNDVVTGSAVDVLTVIGWIASIIAGVFIVLTGVYCGFAMSYCKSVPFWHTGLLPIVFVIMGIADGLALTMGISLVTGDVEITTLESWSRVTLVINALLIKGSTAWVFWIGIVALGIVAPMTISIVTMFLENQVAPLLIVAIICHTIGAFALKYSVLKVGIYRSVLPKVGV